MSVSTAAVYVPRSTHSSDLASLVREHGPSFISQLSEAGVELPNFVAREFEKFSTCGDLQQGYMHLSCLRCGHQLYLPFSCKSRSICPSCMGRRMGETAALLVDHLLPEVNYRHVTLSFAGPLAIRLGYNKTLLSKILQLAGRRIDSQLRRNVKAQHGLASVAPLHAGAFTVVQRFRFDLGLYVHAHMLLSDGAYQSNDSITGEADPEFLAADAWAIDDLKRIIGRLDQDIDKLLEEFEDDHDQIGLASAAQLGRSLQAVGPSSASGGSGLLYHGQYAALHVAPGFDGRDRKRLERQVRYMLRPACALDAVSKTSDGQVRLQLKSGRSTTITPTQLMARLAGMVPPPRFNMVRYRGFLSSRHHLRSRIAFDQTGHVSTPLQLALFECKHGTERAARTPKRPPTPDRIAWSKLLARVFQIDIERCPKCDGKMKIKQAVVDPDLISEGLRNRDLSPPDSVQLPAQDGPPYLPPTAAAHRNLATPPRTGARGPPTLVPLPGQTLLFDACV